MPEAPVYEHGNPRSREYDVWTHLLPLRDLHGQIHAEAGPVSMERRSQRKLGLRVSPAVPTHPLRDRAIRRLGIRQSPHSAHEIT